MIKVLTRVVSGLWLQEVALATVASSGLSSDLTDATTVGKALMVASSVNAGRTALAIEGRLTGSNAGVTATASTTYVGFNSLTGSHHVQLPAATAYNPGHILIIADEDGSCSSSNKLGFEATSGETVTIPGIVAGNFLVGVGILQTAQGMIILECDGVSAWNVVYCTAATTGVALNVAQTWTAAQSFTDGDLVLLGASSGSSTLKAPATGGGTATLFAGTDTIAGLATSQTFTGSNTFNTGTSTFNATANFTSTFKVGSNTMTFPSIADTLAGIGSANTWTAVQTYKQVVVLEGQNSNTLATVAASVEFGAGRGSGSGGNVGSVDGGMTTSDYGFQYGGSGGGYRHWISTQHNNVGTGDRKNHMAFYTNNSTTVGGSSAVGTGNLLVMDLTSGGVIIGSPTGDTKGTATLNVAGAIYFNGTQIPTQGTSNTWSASNTFSGTANFTSTFQIGSNTITFPSAADTLGALGTAGTWTAVQTYNSGKLALKGSSSGTLTVQPVAAAGTNTLTLPGVTDTVAVLGTSQTHTATQTFSGTMNVSGTFQQNSHTFTFPGAADTLAGLGVATQSWTGQNNLRATTLAGANTNSAPTMTQGVEFMVGRGSASGTYGSLDSGVTTGDIALQYGQGGYRHLIVTEHYNVGTNDSRNNIRFFTNTSTTSGGSTAPATGNQLTFSLSSAGLTIGTPTGGFEGVNTLNSAGTMYINGTAVATVSDKRLKENIAATTIDATAMLKSVQVVDFNFMKNTKCARDYGDHTQMGFVAQDLAKVCADWVHVGTDDIRHIIDEKHGARDELCDPWFVQEGRMVPMLVRALQQALSRIEALEAVHKV